MGYVDDNLLAGERVMYRGKIHWGIYIRPIAILTIGILLFCAGGSSGPAQASGATTHDSPHVLGVLGMIIVLVALGMLFARYLTAKSVEYAVTDRRVVIKVGILSRKTMETQLTKVESLNVDQGIIGRIFGYGSVKLTGTGGTHEGYPFLATPVAFKKAVQEQAELAAKRAA